MMVFSWPDPRLRGDDEKGETDDRKIHPKPKQENKMKNIYLLIALIIFSHSFVLPVKAQENLSNEDVAKWVQSAAEQVMTFGFNDYEKRAIDNKKYFTVKGYESFYTAMKRSQIDKLIIENKMIRQAKTICFPEVTASSESPHAWKVVVPMEVVHFDSAKQKRDYLLSTIHVERDPNVNNELHLGIRQWISVGMDESKKALCSEKARMNWEIQNLRSEIKEREARILMLQQKMQQ